MNENIAIFLSLIYVIFWGYGLFTGVYNFIIHLRLKSYLKTNYRWKHDSIYSFEIILPRTALEWWDFINGDELDDDPIINKYKEILRNGRKKFLYSVLFVFLTWLLIILVSTV